MSTAEYRVTVAEDFLGQAGIGIAGFVDYGGAWYAGSRRRTGWDTGIGVRLGASRSSDTGAVRLDLAHRFANDVDDGGLGDHHREGVRLRPAGPPGALTRLHRQVAAHEHRHRDHQDDQQHQRQHGDAAAVSQDGR